MRDYIMVIDEGTTGTRALIFDKQFKIISSSYTEFTQYTPAENMVEHDFEEIYQKTVSMCQHALMKANLTSQDIACLGITNQRCTVCFWDKVTGKPLMKGIVWQDNRAADILDEVLERPYVKKGYDVVKISPGATRAYTQIEWCMRNMPEIARAINNRSALFGTIDTWLVWKLTGGKTYAVSSSNASAMGAFDNRTGGWYEEFFTRIGYPMEMLPEIYDENANYGETTAFGVPIPITGAIADQQASLFAQNCRTPGTAKCTNGTGTFMDINIGEKAAKAPQGLDLMAAWTIDGKTEYMFEGMMGVTGSAVQWLRDGLGIIQTSAETEPLALSVPDTNGVYFVINLAGAWVPRYDPWARGTIFGITRGTTRAHIARATLEGIAFGMADIMQAVSALGIHISAIKIDGGASKNNVLAQMFADYIDCAVSRPESAEGTALGAAEIAALGAGIYTLKTLPDPMVYDAVFHRTMPDDVRDARLKNYRKAVARSAEWLKD